MDYRRILLAAICSLACLPGRSAETASSIDAVLTAGVETGRIPGVIAIAATSDGIFYEGAAGARDMASDTKMTVDTITRIASMTKAVTSVAVMQLVEKGEIGLDRPVGDYLPRLREVSVLEGFDADNQPILRPAESEVTIRQLLTHTSGYVYTMFNANAARLASLKGDNNTADPFGVPLAFDPGARWEYGISADILGSVVEAVSGQTLDDYFREHIFVPLDMPDSHFIVPEEKLSRLATAYAKSDQGELTPIPYSRPSGGRFGGGGGLLSTAGDYVRFMRAFLNGGELDGARVLSAASVNLMAENHIGDFEAATATVSLVPRISNDWDMLPDSADKFGLGFLINTEPFPGGRAAGSLAWAGIYNSYFWIDRESDICGVIITQILPFFDADVLALSTAFEKAVYAAASAAR